MTTRCLTMACIVFLFNPGCGSSSGNEDEKKDTEEDTEKDTEEDTEKDTEEDTGADTDTSVDAGDTDDPDDLDTDPIVIIEDGTIQGDADGETRRFRGIPYAKPPVGELRWKPTLPAEPWDSTLMATKYSAKCAQTSSNFSQPSNKEDCLYLNVWSPNPAPEEPVPVMFWIHGGAHQYGSANDETPPGATGLFYTGRFLVENHDVVVVSFNYRLGVLGFFGLDGLTDEGSTAGNQAILDQQMALSWVKKNIAAFGGDPDNVTIFGESAGAFHVCLHLVAPESQGLFHKAISQSGGCTSHQTSLEESGKQAMALAEILGCSGEDDVLACMRSQKVADLLTDAPFDGGNPDLPGGSNFSGGAPRWNFRPSVDGTVIPRHPRLLFEAGEFAKVPYLLGSNSDEGTLFQMGAPPVTNEKQFIAALKRAHGDEATEILVELYPLDNFNNPNNAIERVYGDRRFGCATNDVAERTALGGSDVYLYNFSRRVPIPTLEAIGMRAMHSAEIGFVFGSISPLNKADKNLREAVQGYWIQFATTGNPNGGDRVEWPIFDPVEDQRIDLNVERTVVKDFRREECEYWSSTYDLDYE
ncbi:MAG: carboxylesterase family protein [Proteobacteria bacterium]|nr:carboxylesterase family protein [Pseudomonadota bacterium]